MVELKVTFIKNEDFDEYNMSFLNQVIIIYKAGEHKNLMLFIFDFCGHTGELIWFLFFRVKCICSIVKSTISTMLSEN